MRKYIYHFALEEKSMMGHYKENQILLYLHIYVFMLFLVKLVHFSFQKR